MTKIEAAVWEAWHRLVHPAPVKAIAAKLGMEPADVAFIVYPAEIFGQWKDDQEPDLGIDPAESFVQLDDDLA